MLKYPKKLPRMARHYNVEDEQAKLAWNYTKLLATLFLLQDDSEFQNMQLDSRLRTIGALNKLVAQSLQFNQDRKFILASDK